MNPAEEPIVPTPVPTPAAEHVAEDYIARELKEAKAGLQRIRIGTGIVVVGLALYLGYVTSTFRANLEPRAAAEITHGMLAQRLTEAEPQFATYLREEVPKFIRQAPDYAIDRLPEYRASMEDRVETDLRSYAKSTSDKLTKEMGEFLTLHKPQIEELLKEGQDPKVTDELGAALEAQFRTYLAEQPAGDTLQARLDNTLGAMDRVEVRTSKLLANKGLTPAEQKARHAIAMLMRRIDTASANTPKLNLTPISIPVRP
ncbi:hypothetical protein EON79_21410 [bacterium]|nr:MAG: hypothetical protein EON79_21410 [bacterium]